MRLRFIGLMVSAATLWSRGDDLSAWMGTGDFWRLGQDGVAALVSNVTVQADTEGSLRTTARGLDLWDLPIVEAVVRFEAARPSRTSFLLYSRGDAGAMSHAAFTGLVLTARARLDKWAGASGRVVPEGLPPAGVRRETFVWNKAGTTARLKYSYSTRDGDGRPGFRAEYVRIETFPLGTDERETVQGLRGRVKRDAASGDVLLQGVPMVDQGRKGYCAVASAERVMRYYGIPVDQHDLAQLASSSAEEGTDPRAMLESLRRLGTRLGCKVRVVEQFSYNEFVRMIDDYNQAAAKKGLPKIPTAQVMDISEIYARMKTDVLRAIRTKAPANVRKFMENAASTVDQGIPLLWGVQLGKIDEDPALPQSAGGHLRLIVGYNRKTGEILYTDSWGAGHELKRMKLENAWTITTALFVIEPRRTL